MMKPRHTFASVVRDVHQGLANGTVALVEPDFDIIVVQSDDGGSRYYADLERLTEVLQRFNKPVFPERMARWILIIVLLAVALSLGGLLLVAFLLIRGAPPVEAERIVKGVLLPYVQTIGYFAATVFGPLLAFILGYYFRRDKQLGANQLSVGHRSREREERADGLVARS